MGNTGAEQVCCPRFDRRIDNAGGTCPKTPKKKGDIVLLFKEEVSLEDELMDIL